MPKYYVRDGTNTAIIDASDEIEACALCVKHFFHTFLVNGKYYVSERGFMPHLEGDKVITSDEVNDTLLEWYKNSFDND